jgi:hypothetical protein
MPLWLSIVPSDRTPNKPPRPTSIGFSNNQFCTRSRSWCQPPSERAQSQVKDFG